MTKTVIYNRDMQPICIVDVSDLALQRCLRAEVVVIRMLPAFNWMTPRDASSQASTILVTKYELRAWVERPLRNASSVVFRSDDQEFEETFSWVCSDATWSYEQSVRRREYDVLIQRLQRSLESA